MCIVGDLDSIKNLLLLLVSGNDHFGIARYEGRRNVQISRKRQPGTKKSAWPTFVLCKFHFATALLLETSSFVLFQFHSIVNI
jgi:hypothetical protein